ncbi:MAG: hypothetical protein ACK4PK_11410 [Alphaproteobacteria bacterium]|jgi:hypothetical protein
MTRKKISLNSMVSFNKISDAGNSAKENPEASDHGISHDATEKKAPQRPKNNHVGSFGGIFFTI